MREMEKLYELWSGTQTDSVQIRKKWSEIARDLSDRNSEKQLEKLEEEVLNYGKLLEKQAFLAGFAEAFRIWREVCELK